MEGKEKRTKTVPFAMNTSPNSERFHALDATRAFALLLGVVFHAAWSFVPHPMGAPISDVSGSALFDWFFFTSHTFRMQLFFMVAGFFAHLVYHKRGFRAFAGNRLMRIGIPFLAGWVVLYPITVSMFVIGANSSGRNMVPVPLPHLFSQLFEQGLIFIPKSEGGRFGLAHLWFLYYLLWIYCLFLGFRWILTRSNRLAEGVRAWSDAFVNRAVTQPRNLTVLALGIGLLLWPQGWFGVNTPARSLLPSVELLAIYGGFFAFGWLLHRQTGLLTKLQGHWQWQLVAAFTLSIPLFLIYGALRERGITWMNYPVPGASQITNWPAFLDRLQAAKNPASLPTELANLWSHFSAREKERILGQTRSTVRWQFSG